jgi:tetratricopeptide (TPR) repeat protein
MQRGEFYMASEQPTVRQISLFALIIQIVIAYGLIAFYYFFNVNEPLLFGLVTYIILQAILRYTITLDHRRGIGLYKDKKYKEAIMEFEKSYAFFSKHRWVDKYKSITLLSASRISYLEMALINMAYCYGQIGKGAKSKELYEEALKEFPDSQMALSALRMLESAKEID